MNNRKPSSMGFTLIELLVVIAIISILAGILFPVFAEAKNTAKRIACLSNMKQISIASMLYLEDSDDRWFPFAALNPMPGFPDQQMWIGYDNNNAPNSGGFFGNVLEPRVNPVHIGILDIYINNEKVKQCSVMPNRWQLSYAANWFNTAQSSDYYNTNPIAAGREFGPTAKANFTQNGMLYGMGANGSEVDMPSYTLFMWEHEAHVPLCNFLQQPDWYDSPPDVPALRDHFHFLHRKGTNVVWCDGHAGWMRYTQLKRPMFSCDKDIYTEQF
ncbi:MAG: type II secretion system protein [Fimbriimonadales bacterium]